MKRKRLSSDLNEEQRSNPNSKYVKKLSERGAKIKFEVSLPILKLSRCDEDSVVPRVKRPRLDRRSLAETLSTSGSIDSIATVQYSPEKDEEVMSLCLKLYERVKQSSEAQLAQRMGVLEQLDEAWSNSKLVLMTCLDFDDEPNFLDLWGIASKTQTLNGTNEVTKTLTKTKSDVTKLKSQSRRVKKTNKPQLPILNQSVHPTAVNSVPAESAWYSEAQSLDRTASNNGDLHSNDESPSMKQKDNAAALRLKRLGSGLLNQKKVTPSSFEPIKDKVIPSQGVLKNKSGNEWNDITGWETSGSSECKAISCGSSEKVLGPFSKRSACSSKNAPVPFKPHSEEANCSSRDIKQSCSVDVQVVNRRTEKKLFGPLSKRVSNSFRDVAKSACSVKVEAASTSKSKLRGPQSKRLTDKSSKDLAESKSACSVEVEAASTSRTKLRGPLSKRVTEDFSKDLAESKSAYSVEVEAASTSRTKLRGPLSKRLTEDFSNFSKDVDESKSACSVEVEAASTSRTKLRGPLSKRLTEDSSKDLADSESACSVEVEAASTSKSKLRGPLSKRVTEDSSKDLAESKSACSVEVEAASTSRTKLRGPLSKRVTEDSSKDLADSESACSEEVEAASTSKSKLRGPLSKRLTEDSSKDRADSESACSVEVEAASTSRTKLRGPLSKRVTEDSSKDLSDSESACSVEVEAASTSRTKLRGPLSKRVTEDSSKDRADSESACSVEVEAASTSRTKLRGPLSKRVTEDSSKDLSDSESACSVEVEAASTSKSKLRGPLSKRLTDKSTKKVDEPSHMAELECASYPMESKLLGPMSKRVTVLSKDVLEPSKSDESDSVESDASTSDKKKQLIGTPSKKATGLSQWVPSCSGTSETVPSRSSKTLLGPLSKRTVSLPKGAQTSEQNLVVEPSGLSKLQLESSDLSMNSPKAKNRSISSKPSNRHSFSDVADHSQETDMITETSSVESTSLNAKELHNQTPIKTRVSRATGKDSLRPVVESAVDKHQTRKSKSKTGLSKKKSSKQTPSRKFNPRGMNPHEDGVEDEFSSDSENPDRRHVNRHAQFDARLHLPTYVLLEPIAVESIEHRCANLKKRAIVIKPISAFLTGLESERSMSKKSTSTQFDGCSKKQTCVGFRRRAKQTDSSPINLISDEEVQSSSTEIDDHLNSDRLEELGEEVLSSSLQKEQSVVDEKFKNEDDGCRDDEFKPIEESNINPASQEKPVVLFETLKNVELSEHNGLNTVESRLVNIAKPKHDDLRSSESIEAQDATGGSSFEIALIGDKAKNDNGEQGANSTDNKSMLVEEIVCNEEEVLDSDARTVSSLQMIAQESSNLLTTGADSMEEESHAVLFNADSVCVEKDYDVPTMETSSIRDAVADESSEIPDNTNIERNEPETALQLLSANTELIHDDDVNQSQSSSLLTIGADSVVEERHAVLSEQSSEIPDDTNIERNEPETAVQLLSANTEPIHDDDVNQSQSSSLLTTGAHSVVEERHAVLSKQSSEIPDDTNNERNEPETAVQLLSANTEPIHDDEGSSKPSESQNASDKDSAYEVHMDTDEVEDEPQQQVLPGKEDKCNVQGDSLTNVTVVALPQETAVAENSVAEAPEETVSFHQEDSLTEMVLNSPPFLDERVTDTAVCTTVSLDASVEQDVCGSGLPDDSKSINLNLCEPMQCDYNIEQTEACPCIGEVEMIDVVQPVMSQPQETSQDLPGTVDAATPNRPQEVLNSSAGTKVVEAFWNGCLGDFDTP